uniref:Putative flagellar protein FliS n=1 Tax=Magnetococcus massalia (strain MO-1) TaxID=451514 RepID=A0A1S7LM41_MAGMO|nr:putative flagellar protein FliS [Candidatus Magnetococcus massalia]
MEAIRVEETAVAGPTQEQLGLLINLYEGAINFLTAAVDANMQEDMEAFRANLQKGRRIIQEFQRTLDFRHGGEVPNRLNSLYQYMLDSLNEADLSGSVAPVDHVIHHLRVLLEGWQGVDLSS